MQSSNNLSRSQHGTVGVYSQVLVAAEGEQRDLHKTVKRIQLQGKSKVQTNFLHPPTTIRPHQIGIHFPAQLITAASQNPRSADDFEGR
jgi:hypothetical protein